MIKRYRNALLEAITEAGLPLDAFHGEHSASDARPMFIVKYRSTPLLFQIRNSPDSPDSFECSYTRFDPAYKAPPMSHWEPKSGYFTFPQVLNKFRMWLKTDGLSAVEEELLPDLWARISSTVKQMPTVGTELSSTFTFDEREQLKIALNTFERSLEQHFRPTSPQRDTVHEHLSYLRDAVDRLNRFDWRSVTMSTLISISVALGLDTEKGRQLFGLFQQAFTAVSHLLK